MNDQDQPATFATLSSAGKTASEKFEEWGVRGILRQLARDARLLTRDARCPAARAAQAIERMVAIGA